MRTPLAALLALSLAVSGGELGAQQRVDLTILGPEGRTTTVTPSTRRGFAAVPLTVLVDLGWRMQGSGAVGPDGSEVTFRAGTPFFRWNGRPLQMTDAAFEEGGTLWVPLQFVSDFLPARMPDRFAFDGPSLTLRAGLPAASAEGDPPPDLRGRAGAPPGRVQGRAGSPPPPLRGREERPPPAAAGRADTVPPDLRGRADRPPPVLSGRAAEPPPTLDEEPVGPYDGPRVVVIDAGHGGEDPGTMSSTGVREKSVALGVALALARQLRFEPDLEVHLIRDDDTFVEVWDRGPRATDLLDERPGVFVSIHANSFTTSARGFETYFLSEARTEHERRVAAIENAPVTRGGTPIEADEDLGFILNELRALDHQHWSAMLAEFIQEELDVIHPGPNRGVKQAPLAVLTNSLMPSVLVEIGYLSHPDEARLLARSEFQERAGRAMSQAVLRFLERYPPRGAATGGGAR